MISFYDKHKDSFWGKYYARINMEAFEKYKSAFTNGHYYSYSSTNDAWLSLSQDLKVGKFYESYALKYYPSSNFSIGLVRSAAFHYMEAGLELVDGFIRRLSGRDNVIYDMHARNASGYLKY